MKPKNKLHLRRETIAELTTERLRRVIGGRDNPVTTSTITIITWDCPAPTDTTH